MIKRQTYVGWQKEFKKIRKGSTFSFMDLKNSGLNANAVANIISFGIKTGAIKETEKKGRATFYKKLRHLQQWPVEIPSRPEFKQRKKSQEVVQVQEKDTVTIPASYYHKLTQTVAEVTKEVVALKKEKERLKELDAILSQYLSKK